jgi:hypothetical protein
MKINMGNTKIKKNTIENALVWIDVKSQTEDIVLLAQSDGDVVFTILNNDCDKFVEHTDDFVKKVQCPFCNPSFLFKTKNKICEECTTTKNKICEECSAKHKICEECATSIIKHTRKCYEICQCFECDCVYCKKLASG